MVMAENSEGGIEYKWNHAQPLGDIPEGAQGSFAQTEVVGARYDDWRVQERLTNGIFTVGTTFVGGDFDQYRFLTHDGITYLVNPTYWFRRRVPVSASDRNLGIGFPYWRHHPF